MNKEELIKLSRENLRKSKQGSLCECYDEALIKGYELSEKRIAELEKENAELKRIVKMVAMINKGVYSDEGINAIYAEAKNFLSEAEK